MIRKLMILSLGAAAISLAAAAPAAAQERGERGNVWERAADNARDRHENRREWRSERREERRDRYEDRRDQRRDWRENRRDHRRDWRDDRRDHRGSWRDQRSVYRPFPSHYARPSYVYGYRPPVRWSSVTPGYVQRTYGSRPGWSYSSNRWIADRSVYNRAWQGAYRPQVVVHQSWQPYYGYRSGGAPHVAFYRDRPQYIYVNGNPRDYYYDPYRSAYYTRDDNGGEILLGVAIAAIGLAALFGAF